MDVIISCGGDIQTCVDAFFQLQNLDQRFNCDAVIFFAHSQGVPVAHIIRHELFCSDFFGKLLGKFR